MFGTLIMRCLGIRTEIVRDLPSTPKITRITYPAKRQTLVDRALARTEADAWRKGKPVEISRRAGEIVVEREDHRVEWRVRP